MSALSAPPPTAKVLGSFYKELREEGVPELLATELVITAARKSDPALVVKLDSDEVSS